MTERYYISGPMTGLPEYNFPAFNEAAERLKARGLDVVNPAELNTHLGTDADWHLYIRNDIRALCDCTHLVLLPGWEGSSGAHLELHLAHRMGLKVQQLDDVLEAAPVRPSYRSKEQRILVADVFKDALAVARRQPGWKPHWRNEYRDACGRTVKVYSAMAAARTVDVSGVVTFYPVGATSDEALEALRAGGAVLRGLR